MAESANAIVAPATDDHNLLYRRDQRRADTAKKLTHAVWQDNDQVRPLVFATRHYEGSVNSATMKTASTSPRTSRMARKSARSNSNVFSPRASA
jgi:hypothetical protein